MGFSKARRYDDGHKGLPGNETRDRQQQLDHDASGAEL